MMRDEEIQRNKDITSAEHQSQKSTRMSSNLIWIVNAPFHSGSKSRCCPTCRLMESIPWNRYILDKSILNVVCDLKIAKKTGSQTCHSIEMKNLDLTNKNSGSGAKNRDHGPIGYKKK